MQSIRIAATPLPAFAALLTAVIAHGEGETANAPLS